MKGAPPAFHALLMLQPLGPSMLALECSCPFPRHRILPVPVSLCHSVDTLWAVFLSVSPEMEAWEVQEACLAHQPLVDYLSEGLEIVVQSMRSLSWPLLAEHTVPPARPPPALPQSTSPASSSNRRLPTPAYALVANPGIPLVFSPDVFLSYFPSPTLITTQLINSRPLSNLP